MIKQLNNNQRKIAVRAVFHKLITGKKMSRVHEETVIEKSKYLLGHGHHELTQKYQEVNGDTF